MYTIIPSSLDHESLSLSLSLSLSVSPPEGIWHCSLAVLTRLPTVIWKQAASPLLVAVNGPALTLGSPLMQTSESTYPAVHYITCVLLLHFTMSWNISPKKCHFPWGIWTPVLIRSSLIDPPKRQTASRSIQPLINCYYRASR